jgi:hypothetical protein
MSKNKIKHTERANTSAVRLTANDRPSNGSPSRAERVELRAGSNCLGCVAREGARLRINRKPPPASNGKYFSFRLHSTVAPSGASSSRNRQLIVPSPIAGELEISSLHLLDRTHTHDGGGRVREVLSAGPLAARRARAFRRTLTRDLLRSRSEADLRECISAIGLLATRTCGLGQCCPFDEISV